MTKMTEPEIRRLTYNLTPGEVRTVQAAAVTVKVYAVAGGSFTRVEARRADGTLVTEWSRNYVFESTALNQFAAIAALITASVSTA